LRLTHVMHGIVLGICAGLIATAFDGLFVVRTSYYIPDDFPLTLFLFNLSLWTIFGCLSGLTYALLLKKTAELHNDFLWAAVFLLPFAIIYGFIGRLHFPYVDLNHQGIHTVTDGHASFLWVSIIILLLMYSLKKRCSKTYVTGYLFMPEIFVIAGLYYFCSNLELHNLSAVLKYSAGVATLFIAYVIFFFIMNRLKKAQILLAQRLMLCTVMLVLGTLFVYLQHKQAIGNESSEVLKNGTDAAQARRAPVILIVLDAMRADRLHVHRDTDSYKNLSRFAKDSLVFDNANSPTSWTLPAHASLFTGLFMAEHMCTGYLSPLTVFALDDSFTTLAEIFKNNGYLTAAITSNYALMNPIYNLDQGFDHYDCKPNVGLAYSTLAFKPILHVFAYLTNRYSKGVQPYRVAEDITHEAVHIIDNLSASPFFLFLNYMEPHAPYRPPRPYDGMFADNPFTNLTRMRQYRLRALNTHDKATWDSYLLGQYDGEIAYLDTQLGKLFEDLKRREIYDQSLIIVTSDHGELFGEHNLYGHNTILYEGAIRIPLMIKLPLSFKTGIINSRINLTDVFATILELCGLPIPHGIHSKPFGGTNSTVSEFYGVKEGVHRIIYSDRYKLLSYNYDYEQFTPPNNMQLRGYELYDIVNDPDEHQNIASQLPDVVQSLTAQLRTWETQHRPKLDTGPLQQETVIPDKLKQGLRALGYVE
jgi:arylsulfatase A-like enzyme